MSENSNNNRRAELAAQDKINTGMNSIKEALSEEYDVLPTSQLENASVMECEFGNAIGVALTIKYNVYGNRFYGEGTGSYHVSDGSIYEDTDLKFGSIKIDENEIKKEETFFFFKKGSLSSIYKPLNIFSGKAEDYFTIKSIKSAKKAPSNGIFNFYITLIMLSLISVIAFFGLVLFSYISFSRSPEIDASILGSCVGGAKTIWLSLIATTVLSVIGAIIHGTKISVYRPTGRGKTRNVNFSLHCFILSLIELFTIAFAALKAQDNIWGYTIGYLFYPLTLVCLLYPIIMFALLILQRESFTKEGIKRAEESLSKETYESLSEVEKNIREVAVRPDKKYIEEIVLRCVYSDTQFSVWNK